MMKIKAAPIRSGVCELLLHAVSVALMCLVSVHAQAQDTLLKQDARLETDRAVQSKVQEAITTDGRTPVDVLPGGDNIVVRVAAADDTQESYRAKLIDEKNAEKTVTVISATLRKSVAGEEQKQWIDLTLGIPDSGFGPQKKMRLVIATLPKEEAKSREAVTPTTVAIQPVKVSSRGFATSAAVAAVVLAYLIVVLAVGRIKKHYAWSPVYLTSGVHDIASLSQFQIFGFTLLVFGLLVYVMFRLNVLPNISSDILLLLGISAVGTAGSKVAGVMKKRLSMDNWAWLRNNGWLTVYELGSGSQGADTSRARWGDLFKTEGCFDVYSFQLIVFSVLVGYSLLTSDLRSLATFAIPQNLLALLGLSNAVYIAGKAVAPNSVGELDDKVTTLRAAEADWVGAVAKGVIGLTDQQAKQTAAIKSAPDRYTAYITAAREAAGMLKTIYGTKDTKGTKFAVGPIDDSEIMPVFP
jgi:hypothetical protein